MKLHGNARTCPKSRRLLVERIVEEGWSRAQAAEAAADRTRSLRWVLIIISNSYTDELSPYPNGLVNLQRCDATSDRLTLVDAPNLPAWASGRPTSEPLAHTRMARRGSGDERVRPGERVETRVRARAGIGSWCGLVSACVWYGLRATGCDIGVTTAWLRRRTRGGRAAIPSSAWVSQPSGWFWGG